jgi:hypothetical protein
VYQLHSRGVECIVNVAECVHCADKKFSNLLFFESCGDKVEL